MPRKRLKPIHYLEYAGWRIIGAILWLLPRRMVVLASDFFGWLMCDVFRARRNVVEENLRLAFGDSLPEAEFRRIVRRCYQNNVLSFFEFMQPDAAFYSVQGLYDEAEGRDHLMSVKDKVPVLVTAHMGNWEASAVWVARQGIPMAALAKALHNPLVNQNTLDRRKRAGVEILVIPQPVQVLVRALKGGRSLAFLGDQDARRHGIFVDFFGRPASTATGAALLARRLNLPILAGFCWRDGSSQRRLRMRIYPAVYPDPNLGFEEDIERMTQDHVKCLEDAIRHHPDSYFWFHRRWKTRPKRQKVEGPGSTKG